jgi:hypothetical protein
LFTIIAIFELIQHWVATPENHDLRLAFGDAVLLLYAQVGLLLTKWLVVAWRTPIPEAQAKDYLEAREQTRGLYLQLCDWCRLVYSIGLLFCPVLLYASPSNRARLSPILLIGSIAIGIVLQIWQEMGRKRVLALCLRIRPMRLPELFGQPDSLKWPVCYKPAAPVLVLKGAHGYSVNLANTLAQLSAAYLAGLVALIAVLRTGR